VIIVDNDKFISKEINISAVIFTQSLFSPGVN